MKKTTALLFALFSGLLLSGQAPQGFNYQCVIRDANGIAQPNQTVSLVFTLKDGSPFGVPVFSEEHNNISTNNVGLINVQIGAGLAQLGTFSNVNWGSGPKYLETGIKNGVVVTSLGTVQLMSVPYALYAASSGTGGGNYTAGQGININGNVISNAGDADSNPSNEIQSLAVINGNQLNISGGNTVTLPTGTTYSAGPGIDINGNVISNTGDLSSNNEIQSLTVNGAQLSISGGNTVTLPTGTTYSAGTGIAINGNVISNTGDLSGNNEVQSLSVNGAQLSISGGNTVTLPTGTTYSAGTGIAINGNVISNTGDTDSSPTNEFQSLSLSGNQLTISNGNSVTLLGDADSNPNNELQSLTVNGNQLTISNGNTVTLPSGTGSYTAGTGININGNVISNTGDLSTNNELQTLSVNGNQLIISNGNSVTLPSDADGNPSNELQLLSVNGNQLTISNGNTVTLSTGANYTAGPGININGSLISNTGDLSSNNEIQSLLLSGNQLSISGGNSVFLPLSTSKWDYSSNHISNNNAGSVFIKVPNPGSFSSPANLNVQTHTGLISPDQTQLFNMTIDNDGSLRFNANTLNGTGNNVIIFDDEDYSLRIPGIPPSYFYGGKMRFGDGDYVYLHEYLDDRLEIFANNELDLTSTTMDIYALDKLTLNSDKLEITTLASGEGYVETRGPNGFTNAQISSLLNYSNNGYVAIHDAGGNIQAGVYVNASGQGVVFGDVKNFRMKHPDRPGKEIWYASLEGPEAAAYVRGTAKLLNGEAFVEFSEDYAIVANPSTMTVILTPLSADSKGMAVIEKTKNGFKVKELSSGTGNYSFDWEVKCVRKGYEDYQVVRDETESQPTTSVRQTRLPLPEKQPGGETKPQQPAKPDKF